MVPLEALLSSRLKNLRRTADGFVAQCPACAAQGRDLHGMNHLHVWENGAFWCSVGSTKRPDDAPHTPCPHNRAIWAAVFGGADPTALALLETTTVDPDPKLVADRVFPEDMLTRLAADHRYWVGRGVSEEVLVRLEGGLVPDLPRNQLSGRYVFPVRCITTRRIIGWIGRLVSDASFGPKYKNMLRTKRVVYPLTVNEAAIRRARKVVLVEGPSDLIILMTHGIDYCLCLFGLNLNSRLLSFLVAANLDEVVISTNRDTGRTAPDGTVSYPGQEAAAKARAKLVPYLGESRVRIRAPETAKDWSETVEKGTNEIAVFKAELEGRAPEALAPQSPPTP